MPQTLEAIEHARAAKVPIIVAINKIDKENADPERVKRQLAEQNLAPEEWGGETICVEVSALRKEGIETLLEMILLQAEMMELSADPAAPLRAVVVESEIDRQKGPSSTLIIQQGTLHVGDVLIGEKVYGRVRALMSWAGKRVQQAGPSTPVQILGLSDVSNPGQVFVVAASEKEARRMAQEELQQAREQSLRRRERVTLETIFGQPEDETKHLNVVLKADSQGALRALVDVLANMKEENVEVEILSQGVGEVKKSDILLASSSDAVILTFNVPVGGDVQALALREEVEIREYQVIYNILEDIEQALQGLLEPTYEKELIGKVEIRDVFRIPRVGLVAGCYVSEGRATRDAQVELVRSGEPIATASIVSLKRFERDVKEVTTGLECGIRLQGVDEFQKGDVIQVYQQKRTR
jgi:translation initiation factor IF-2